MVVGLTMVFGVLVTGLVFVVGISLTGWLAGHLIDALRHGKTVVSELGTKGNKEAESKI
jgi:hypothetical protein